MTTKKTLGGAIKWFKALVLVIYMTYNALLPCQVTHRSHLLFPKTRLCLLSIAKMAKLSFWPSLALYHSQEDPWRGNKMFGSFYTYDRHDNQCTASMSSNLWGSLTLSENQNCLLSMAKMAKMGLGPTLALYHNQ